MVLMGVCLPCAVAGPLPFYISLARVLGLITSLLSVALLERASCSLPVSVLLAKILG